MEHTLDSIDKKIIEILQANARTPIKDIASEVFLSSPAVSSRIEKMEKAGIISGYHAQINYLLFGYHIKAFINLEVEPYQKKEFYPFIQAIPNVIECNCVTGDYAMLIEVAFQTTIELDHFINELQHFGRTKTLIVFSTSVEHRDVPVVWLYDAHSLVYCITDISPNNLYKFSSAALSSIDVATATPHSSALQTENLSCVI